MSPSATLAVVTFLTGVILLLGWAYATAGNPRSGKMLKKSLLVFALPIFFAPWRLIQFPLAMWVWIGCEEGLKAFASRQEGNSHNRFWLVSLFGIWELILDKPIVLWSISAQSKGILSSLQIVGFVYSAALPVLMHSVTAAIYAFAFEERIWLAFTMSWIVHTSFNEAVDFFGLSVAAALVESAILVVILAIAVKHPWRPAKNQIQC